MGAQQSDTISWLAKTKVHAPLLRTDLVPRQRILDLLYSALMNNALTLLSAPAGYGKTTLLAQLINAFPTLPVAWLTLDQEDSVPTRLLAALATSLQRLHPTCGATVQALLRDLDVTAPVAEARRLISALINDILETLSEPFVLVLEDLHSLNEPAAYLALDYLLERLPPQMHIVAATRYDPPLALARLRARGQLAELRLPDLCFTLEETQQFLNEKLDLRLSGAELTVLHSRFEGWAAGLRLLAGTLDRVTSTAARSAFISNLAHTPHYIFDFLADEVLKSQPPEIQTFLLETSILSELTPALCQAVTGRSDAGAILEDLYRRNLFLIAVDLGVPSSNLDRFFPGSQGADLCFRYHALFASFLVQRLQQEMPNRLREIHRRAALTHHDPSRAIRHYLDAELWEEAALAIEQVSETLVQQGQIDSIMAWIQTLPSDIQMKRPRLTYLQGLSALQRRNITAAAQYLEQAQRSFEASGGSQDLSRTLASLAYITFLQNDIQRGYAMLEQALKYPIPPHIHVQLLLERGRVAIFLNDLQQAWADRDAAWEVYQTYGDSDTFYALLAGFMTGFLALPQGLDRLEQLCQSAAASRERDNGRLQVVLEEQWALVHFYRGRLEQALQATESALALAERMGGLSPWEYWSLKSLQISLYFISGNTSLLTPLLDQILVDLHTIPEPMLGLPYIIAHICWAQGRVEETRRIYHFIQKAKHPGSLITPILLAILEGLLATTDGHYDAAEQALRRAVDLEVASPLFNLFGSTRIILALLYLEWQRPEPALETFGEAVVECQQQGALGRLLSEGQLIIPLLRLALERGVHADVAAQLLETLRAPSPTLLTTTSPVRIPTTGEMLTSREVEVLRLLANGSSNKAIAEQLVITERTVKAHITNILAKLQVASRTQAAALARELAII